MITHKVKQGSPEWLQLRAGIPTASEFDALLTPKWKIKTGEGPRTYLIKKITEKALGMPLSVLNGGFQSEHMEIGSILEHEALPWLSFTQDLEIERVGFCTTDDGLIGCSPDGLIGDDGGVECKCPKPETHLGWLLDGVLPEEHAAQVYGSMFVTGRKWWKFMSYSRQFPAFVIHVDRDEKIMGIIKTALDAFLAEFATGYARIKAMKDSENAVKQKAYEKSNTR